MVDRANQIVDSMTDGIFAFDREFRLTLWNRSMERIFGVVGRDVLGANLLERFPFLERVRPSFVDVLHGRAVSPLSPFPIPPDRGSAVYEASYSPLVDDGAIVGGFAVIKEASAHVLADGAPVLLWMSGADGLCTYFNERWCEFTGRTLQENAGVGWAEGVHPEDLQERIHTYLGTFVARREFKMEYRLRRADGQYRWVLDVGRPRYTTDGQFAGYVGSCVDVTETREAHQALEALKRELETKVRERTAQLEGAIEERIRSESRLSEAQAIAHVGSWQWETGIDKITWSDELFRIFGVSREELRLSYDAYLERIHPDDRQLVNDIVREAHRSHQPVSFEHRIIRPDGEERILKCHSQVAVDASGRPIRLLGTAQDITDQRRSDETQMRLVQEQAARQEAQREVEGRDVFVTVAAHELRTPLNALMLGLEALDHMVKGRQGKALETILFAGLDRLSRQTKRLATLVENLFDLSHISRGRLEIVRVGLQLAAIVREVVDRLGEEAKRAGCTITVTGSVDVVGVWDRLRIEQVVTNLLSNALKYGRRRPVEVSVEGDDIVARLRIRDHGIGIAAEDLPRLFTPFERAASIRQIGGLGLGLHVAKQITEAHGGTIFVESTPGAGSTFLVELPRGRPRMGDESRA